MLLKTWWSKSLKSTVSFQCITPSLVGRGCIALAPKISGGNKILMSKNIGVARLICENTKLKSYYACHKVYHTAKYSGSHAPAPFIFSHCSPIVLPQSFGSSSEKTSFFRRRPEETPVMTRRKPEAIRSKSVRTSQNQSQPVTGVQAAIFCFNFVSLTNKIICYGNIKQRNPRRILR